MVIHVKIHDRSKWKAIILISGIISITILVAIIFFNRSAMQVAPYPQSKNIIDIEFDLSTLRNNCPGNKLCAPGSDNWAITWADDDNQYASWGDGGGFGGDNDIGRVSMGFARIEGNESDYSGYNIWGGNHPESIQTTFPGKCYGILCSGGVLYAWRSYDNENGSICYMNQELYKSIDYGKHWYPLYGWFNSPGFFCPTFLQAGKDYSDSPDQYVYAYLPERTETIDSPIDNFWNVQLPGKISLMRCHKDSLDNKTNWNFYAGKGKWSSDKTQRKAVFTDSKKGIMRTSAIYNIGLKRYILTTQHVSRFGIENGYIGIYESRYPWGPWRTVLLKNAWDTGIQIKDKKYKTVYWNFSPKWMSRDGKKFVMVYTGAGSDEWGTVEGTFVTTD